MTGPEVGLQAASANNFQRPDPGQDVYTGDRIRTGVDSHLQLKLCDWSTYTFSPLSESSIDEFYDAAGARQRRLVNFVRGGFRLASGRNTQPGDTEVKIQESGVTMGVRGTSVLLVELDGVVYALLEGPLLDNNGFQPRGEVSFWTGENRDAITSRLRRPGWVVTIGPDGVGEPFRADADLLRRIYQAFVPVIPEDDGGTPPNQFAGDPADSSGQGTQEGEEGQQYANNDAQGQSQETDNVPEQPFNDDSEDNRPMSGLTPGDVLPLDALESFAAAQVTPDGHVIALVSTQLFVDSGAGAMLADEGVALIQLSIDWESRTLAPLSLASFTKLDFSVSDPTDLTNNDLDFTVPDEVEDAYIEALLAGAGIPFASGANGLAEFTAPLFALTIRQGLGDTATVDVSLEFATVDLQANEYEVTGSALDLAILPGPGELAFFVNDFADIFEPSDLPAAGGARLAGPSDTIFNVAGPGAEIDGISYGELEVDFDNRTIGGGSSFVTFATDADFAYIALDQATSLDGGLFGLTFYPISSLTNDPSVLQGEAILFEGDPFGAEIAAIVETESGAQLYTNSEIFSFLFNNPVSTIAGLEGLAMALGPVDFRYDGTVAGRGFGGFSELFTAAGPVGNGSAEASIDINFASRTIGGGNSFVSVDIQDSFSGVFFQFTETLAAQSFDDAANGLGIFGFDGADFSGTNVDAALLLIRDGTSLPGETADFFFDFNDGAGGDGYAEFIGVGLQQGATP
ncbi:MAG: hypothetical protein AAFW81_05880 [Pseudomonadota bacterium]